MKKAPAALFFVIFSVWASLAAAQTTWIQIEAHSNLAEAQARARAYAGIVPDVNGFRLSTGWYAIALGPYDENGAVTRLGRLKSRGLIPPDGFLVDGSVYSQQFWPVGARALTSPPIRLPAADDVPEVTQPAAPAAETPAVQEPPEETRAQALRSESRLSRQQKFDLQIALQWFGFYTGRIDASFGPATRNSMAAWQRSVGHDPTGVLSSRQRSELAAAYEAVLASLGLAEVSDDRAGVALDMPTAMVAFDRYDPPFAHYMPTNDSGVTVLLISQTGDEATLLGLYDIMQTLEIVPLEGTRERKNDRFTLTGENDKITSYTYAELKDGTVKGFTLIWPAGQDRRREVALKAMRDSFTVLDGVLPDVLGEGTLDQDIDLISGLQIRRPERSRSGFYIDGRGSVLTTTSAVAGCARVTLDETYEAEIVASDTGLGVALLQPQKPLAPVGYARFRAAIPRIKSEVAVAGYSYEGVLNAPTLTFGTLADVKGLHGERSLNRLALAAGTGDAGGPVFDTSGSVMGMLLPPDDQGGKRLPDNVSFAVDAMAIAEFLSNAGYSPAASDQAPPMTAEEMTRLAANVTVLVSCWD